MAKKNFKQMTMGLVTGTNETNDHEIPAETSPVTPSPSGDAQLSDNYDPSKKDDIISSKEPDASEVKKELPNPSQQIVTEEHKEVNKPIPQQVNTPQPQPLPLHVDVQDDFLIQTKKVSREIKSKRVGLLMRPSLYARFKEVSALLDISVNDAAEACFIRFIKDFEKQHSQA